MNYRQTLDYLYTKLPMFHRMGAAAYKIDLGNTIQLDNFLGNPHKQFKSIHIAGTNGKGSVSHFIASILQEAGYKIGLYTSPHLIDFRERIRIDGKFIPEEDVIDFIEKLKSYIEEIKPSFFEVTVVMAFEYFAKEKVDFAIIETGLGGRLDSTNIIAPILSVITNISYDHQNLLGNTLQQIAYEKAGIIKSRTPVVIGKKDIETEETFINKAQKENAEITFAEDILTLENFNWGNGNLHVNFNEKDSYKEAFQVITPLGGIYQLENLSTTLAAIIELRKKYIIDEKSVIDGIRKVIENTGIRGRWEILNRKPLIIADVAHNEAGIQNAIKQLERINFQNLLIIYGMVNDKNPTKALSSLPKDANYFFCCPNIPRGLPSIDLSATAKQFGLNGKPYDSVEIAYQAAKNQAKDNDLILCLGSFFVISEILQIG